MDGTSREGRRWLQSSRCVCAENADRRPVPDGQKQRVELGQTEKGKAYAGQCPFAPSVVSAEVDRVASSHP